MKTPITIVPTGWNINDPDLHRIIGYSTKAAIIAELERVGCPLRMGRYVYAAEWWEAVTKDNSAISSYKGKSEESKGLLA